MSDTTFTPHRVPHDRERADVTVEHWEGPGRDGLHRLVSKAETIFTNRITACPDCGRELQSVRDDLAPVRILICPQIEGLDLAYLDDLTEDDIVACGVSDGDS